MSIDTQYNYHDVIMALHNWDYYLSKNEKRIMQMLAVADYLGTYTDLSMWLNCGKAGVSNIRKAVLSLESLGLIQQTKIKGNCRLIQVSENWITKLIYL